MKNVDQIGSPVVAAGSARIRDSGNLNVSPSDLVFQYGERRIDDFVNRHSLYFSFVEVGKTPQVGDLLFDSTDGDTIVLQSRLKNVHRRRQVARAGVLGKLLPDLFIDLFTTIDDAEWTIDFVSDTRRDAA